MGYRLSILPLTSISWINMPSHGARQEYEQNEHGIAGEALIGVFQEVEKHTLRLLPRSASRCWNGPLAE